MSILFNVFFVVILLQSITSTAAFVPLASRRRNAVSSLALSSTSTPSSPSSINPLSPSLLSYSKQWYPVIVDDQFDRQHAQQVTLLGKTFVVYYDKVNERYHCLDEHCPHRLASLVTGKIDDNKGTIQCRYHGWSFDGNGTCVNIPNNVADNKCSALRSSTTSYPVELKQGLVWLWPDSSKDRYIQSCLQEIPVVQDKDEDKFTSWFVKEWPLDYLIMLENNFDPSHAMFLHDNTFSFNSSDALPMDYFKLSSQTPKQALVDEDMCDHFDDETANTNNTNTKISDFNSDGLTVYHGGYNVQNINMNASRSFVFPCTSVVRYNEMGKKQVFNFYFIPTRLGKTTVIGRISILLPAFVKKMIKTVGPVIQSKFASVNHLLNAMIHIGLTQLEQQDIAGMYPASLALNRFELSSSSKVGGGVNTIGYNAWKKRYYLATPSDYGVLILRRWFDKYTKGHVHWIDGSSVNSSGSSNSNGSIQRLPELTSIDFADRWYSHGKNCIHCSKSYFLMNKAIQVTSVLKYLSIVSFIFTRKVAITILLYLFIKYIEYNCRKFQHALVTSTPYNSKMNILRLNYQDLPFIT